MQLKIGQTLVSTVDTTTVIVVRCPAHEVEITCGGQEMVAPGATPVASSPSAGTGGAELGKRYVLDGLDDLELLCVKAGTHALEVDGAPVTLKGAKPLPASD